jgi:hypothetical protein
MKKIFCLVALIFIVSCKISYINDNDGTLKVVSVHSPSDTPNFKYKIELNLHGSNIDFYTNREFKVGDKLILLQTQNILSFQEQLK